MDYSECGSILILVLVMISGLLVLGLFLQDHLLMQSRIVQNLYMEMKTYYLSQAGIEYTRYRIKRDFGWTSLNQVIPISDSEQILLKANRNTEGVAVESCGVVQQFRTTSVAHFTRVSPIIRIN